MERFDSEFGGGALRYGEVLFKKIISMFNPVEIDDCPEFIATKYVPLSDILCWIGEINFISWRSLTSSIICRLRITYTW